MYSNYSTHNYKHILYSGHSECTQNLFSKKNFNFIKQKVESNLINIIPNKKIVITDKVIESALSSIQYNFKPTNIGDIYTRYNIKKNNNNCSYDQINQETINFITEDIKNQILNQLNNAKLTKWDTILGQHNKHNIIAHPKIKLKQKRPAPFQFHMNY